MPALSQRWVRRSEPEDLLLEGAWDKAERLAHTFLDTVPQRLISARFLGLGPSARWRGEPAEAWSSVSAGLPSGRPSSRGSTMFQVRSRCSGRQLALDDDDLPTPLLAGALDRWLAGAARSVACGRTAPLGALPSIAGDLDRASQTADEALAEASGVCQPLVLLAAHRLVGELTTETGCYTEATSI